MENGVVDCGFGVQLVGGFQKSNMEFGWWLGFAGSKSGFGW